MPIEKERKYIIDMSKNVEQKFAQATVNCLHIEQKYLTDNKGITVRIRRIEYLDNTKNIDYYLTVKKKVNLHIVEIESLIAIDDFNKLWSVGTCYVNKYRYLYNDWDVDFFKYKNKNYFAMAEFEMPFDQDVPKSIPKLIQDHLIYEVEHTDNRFSSKRMHDREYAAKIIRWCKKI